MIITFDPDADAIYVTLTGAAVGAGWGETVIDDYGNIIDTDELGSPRGFEFLAVNEHRFAFDGLPIEVAVALQNFIEGGSLASTIPVEAEYP